MDKDESVHTDADPMQQAKQSKSHMAGFGALISPVLLWTGGVVRLRYEEVYGNLMSCLWLQGGIILFLILHLYFRKLLRQLFKRWLVHTARTARQF